MRLLMEYSNLSEAKLVANNLRKRGILTFVSSQHSAAVLTLLTGAGRVGLWVVFDKQFSDAAKIVAGIPCKVERPLTEEDMREIEFASKHTAGQLFQKFINAAILGLIIFVLAIFILVNLLS